MERKNWMLYTLFLLLIVAWSFNWPIMTVGLQQLPDIWFAATRLILATLIIFAWMSIRGTLKIPSRRDFHMIFSQGFLQLGFYVTLVLISLHLVGASHTVILSYTILIWTTPIAIFVFKEHCSKRKFLGIILGFIGIIIYFNPFTLNWHDKNLLIGGALSLIAAFAWALAILHSRYGRWHSTPLQLYPWQMLAASIPVTIAAFIFTPHPHIIWHGLLFETLSYSVLIATVFAWWAMTVVSKNLPSSTTSMGLLAIPVLAVILSVCILHEKLNYSMIIALITITLGVFLVALDSSRERKKQQLSHEKIHD